MTHHSPELNTWDSEFEPFLFAHNAAPMLIIDPSTGQIIDANSAAAEFYGWPQDQLRRMRIQDINTFSEEQILQETETARTLNRNHFEFVHRLANGSIRHVRVFSTKFDYRGRPLLHLIITDISEQKMAEELLINNDRMLTDWIEQSPVVYELYDTKGLQLKVNSAWEKLWGVPKEYCLGKYNILQDPQVLGNGWLPYFEKALAGEVSILPELEYDGSLTPSTQGKGKKRWISTIAYPIKNESGEITNIVVLHEDVTERKRAEEALQKSELRFRSLIEQSPIPIGISIEGNSFFVNSAYLQLFGYQSEKELLGHPLLYLIAPRSREYLKEIIARSKNNENADTSYEAWGLRKDGSEFLMHVTTARIALPEGVASVAFFSDITERKRAENALKESEKKFRFLFDSLPICVGITTIDTGKFLELNAASIAMTGYDIDTLNELGAAITYAKQSDRDRMLQVLEEKGSVDNFETVLKRRDGTLYDALINIKIIQLNGEDVLLSNIQDITERKKSEEALRNSQRFESLGLMAGGIAHDFNNILGGIIGYAEMSKDCVPPESNLSSYLDKILVSADRAKDLVNQILSFSRRRSDRMDPVYIRPIVNEVIGLLKATLPSSIELKCSVASDTRPVLANSTRIHEVIMNLCVNAAYAMKNKGTLEISHKEQLLESELIGKAGMIQPGLYSVISVKDSGCGISPEILSKIFEPYFTTKPIGEGTGLGLSVVFGIVQNHKGNIIVESTEGKGTEFNIFLPKSTEDSVCDKVEELSIKGGSERILLIDDEVFLCEMVRDMLTSLGYKVSIFSDSFKALMEIKYTPEEYDLIITDQTMPKISGFELSKEILRIRRDIPIILCTGYSNDLDESAALSAGIAAMCMKPIRKADIANKIRMVIDKTE